MSGNTEVINGKQTDSEYGLIKFISQGKGRHCNCQEFCKEQVHVRTNEKTNLKEITFVLG